MASNLIENSSPVVDPFDALTADTVEEELRKLKLIEENYVSDDEEQDRVRLTGKGIDINLLKAGEEVEFETRDPEKEEDNYDWSDEIDEKRSENVRKSLYEYRKQEMVLGDEADENNNNEDENETTTGAKTPFEMLREKMVDVSDAKDGGVMKRMLIQGTGQVAPLGSRVRIHYNAYFELNDEPFDSTYLRSRSQEFRLGDGSVVPGLDMAVSTMRKLERAQFIIEPKYFMGERGCPPRVPGNIPVLFEVELLSFIEANEYEDYENTPEEQRKKLSLASILKICNCLRELGNDTYRRNNFKEASKKYRKAIYLLENTRLTNEEEEKKWKGVMLKLYLNMSQVSLKQVKPKKAIFFCKLALDFDPKNVKALFRYGMSLRILQDFDRSRLFLQKANNLSPGNKDIIAEIAELNNAVEKWRFLEKDLYKKMFNGSSQKKTSLAIESSNAVATKLDEKDPNFKIKEQISQILNDFAKNEQMKVYKIANDMYSKDVVEFAMNLAKSLNLHIRNIKGETDVLHILKSV